MSADGFKAIRIGDVENTERDREWCINCGKLPPERYRTRCGPCLDASTRAVRAAPTSSSELQWSPGAPQWGDWWADWITNNTIVFVAHRYTQYYVPMDRCADEEERDDWVNHVSRKLWCSEKCADDLHRALVETMAAIALRESTAAAMAPPKPQAPRARPVAPTFVYFIRAGAAGPIKIGYSATPVDRLSTLQTATHEALTLLAHVAGDVDDERRLHDRFAHLRQRGEWFRAEQDLLDLIAQVQRDGKIPVA
jgi:hypothetical protein